MNLMSPRVGDTVSPQMGAGLNPGRLDKDLLILKLSGPAGLVLGCLISILICLKRKWAWINTLVVFLIALLLDKLNFLGWDYLQSIFLTPGGLMRLEAPSFFLVNGSIMLLIGLLIFFMRWSMIFINSARKVVS